MADDDVLKFTVDGRAYELDMNLERLKGDELLEIEDRTGLSMTEWARRLQNIDKVSVRDILLMAFLAERRKNPIAEWDPFVKGIAPLTFKWGHGVAPRTRKTAAS